MPENLCTSAKQLESGRDFRWGDIPPLGLLGDKTMQRMMCTICGHVYDPEKGDSGMASGEAFENVPADWSCPVCGAEKSKFIPSG